MDTNLARLEARRDELRAQLASIERDIELAELAHDLAFIEDEWYDLARARELPTGDAVSAMYWCELMREQIGLATPVELDQAQIGLATPVELEVSAA